MTQNSSELNSYNLIVQKFLKANPTMNASDVSPGMIVEYAKACNYNLFGGDNKSRYMVDGSNILFQTTDGQYDDFNTQNGVDVKGSLGDLYNDFCTNGKTDNVIGNLYAADTSYLTNGAASVTQYAFNDTTTTSNWNHITLNTKEIDFSGDAMTGNTAQAALKDKGGAALTTITNAINNYVSQNGTPSSLQSVFGINDPNIVFNQTDTSLTMHVVQNGNDYIVTYDTTNGTTSISQSDAGSLGYTSGDVTPQYAVTQNAAGESQVTYTLDFSQINFTQSADQADVKTAISSYANNNGTNNPIDLRNIFGQGDGQHLYTSNGNQMIYIQGGNAYVTTYTPSSSSSKAGTTSIVQITAANAAQYGVTLPAQATASGYTTTLNFAISNGQLQDSYTIKGPNGTTTNSGSSSSWGDPHFTLNGQYAFDFQGVNAQETSGTSSSQFTMLNGSDVNITGTFTEAYGSNGSDAQGSTIMTQESIKDKATGITVTGNNNGTYTITDSSGKTLSASDAAKAGVSISQSGDVLTVTDSAGRTTVVELSGCMNNDQVTTKAGDTGLLTQTGEAISGKYDDGQYMVGGDSGSAVSAPVLIYQSDNASTLAANMLKTLTNVGGISYISTVMNQATTGSEPTDPVAKAAYDSAKAIQTAISSGNTSNLQSLLTTWITDSSAAMLQDINSGTGSIASRFQAGHGYSTSQWNEFFGTIENEAGSNVVKNADGSAKGITVNGQENDFLINPDSIFVFKETGANTNNNWS